MALIAPLALAGLYAGDYLSARYRIPGNRQTLGSVQVQTLYAAPQKNGRIESWVGDSGPETCVRSLFPQLGYPPCWYLSRHPRKTIVIGGTASHRKIKIFRARLFNRLPGRAPGHPHPAC